MPLRDVAYLIFKPFMGAKRGKTKAEVLSVAVEHSASKDRAAEFTRVADLTLEQVALESKLERERLKV